MEGEHVRSAAGWFALHMYAGGVLCMCGLHIGDCVEMCCVVGKKYVSICSHHNSSAHMRLLLPFRTCSWEGCGVGYQAEICRPVCNSTPLLD
jgi:hypothetical protein